MYIPAHNGPPTADDVGRVLQATRAGDLVTVGEDGLTASMIPFLFDPSRPPRGSLLGHLARPNRQWRGADGRKALVLVHGPDGYVSPAWYPAKREHGRVVPTWNYVLVAVHGTVRVHDDPEWTRDVVERLTQAHEEGRTDPWAVSDAPGPYIAGQLKAIVGIEVEIERIEAKWKLGQNRSAADVVGVIAGLEDGSDDDRTLAAAMAAVEAQRSGDGFGERPLGERVDRLERQVRDIRLSRRRLVQAADADRRAIERALHDGIQQDLAALSMGLRRLSGLLDPDAAAAKALLDELAADVRVTMEGAAALAHRIHPPLLENRGLASALRSAAEVLDITLSIDIPSGVDHPPDVTAAIYWSCLEVLSSAAPASEASVSVRGASGSLSFELVIAGALDEDRLQRLRDLVEAFDGHLRVEPDERGGSRVRGWLPSAS